MKVRDITATLPLGFWNVHILDTGGHYARYSPWFIAQIFHCRGKTPNCIGIVPILPLTWSFKKTFMLFPGPFI